MKLKSTLPLLVFLILPLVARAEIPSSDLSNRVIQKTKPKLEKALKRKGLAYGSPIMVRIFKQTRSLEVWVQGESGYQRFKQYPICAFSGSLGPKVKQGDFQTPEGFYTVTAGQLNPYSKYHLAINVGYPNVFDKLHDRTGNSIMVHGRFQGRCGSRGCFAMKDKMMDEIYTLAHGSLANGQSNIQVQIFPFELTDDNLKRYENSRWFSFWENLKEGYEYFEKYRLPPPIAVKEKKYVVK